MMEGVVPIFLPSAAMMSAPCGLEFTSTWIHGFGFLMIGGLTTTGGLLVVPASTAAGGGVWTLAPASATAGGGGVTPLPLVGSGVSPVSPDSPDSPVWP